MKKTTNSNTVNISNLTKQKKPKTLPLNSKSYFNFVKPEKKRAYLENRTRGIFKFIYKSSRVSN